MATIMSDVEEESVVDYPAWFPTGDKPWYARGLMVGVEAMVEDEHQGRFSFHLKAQDNGGQALWRFIYRNDHFEDWTADQIIGKTDEIKVQKALQDFINMNQNENNHEQSNLDQIEEEELALTPENLAAETMPSERALRPRSHPQSAVAPTKKKHPEHSTSLNKNPKLKSNQSLNNDDSCKRSKSTRTAAQIANLIFHSSPNDKKEEKIEITRGKASSKRTSLKNPESNKKTPNQNKRKSKTAAAPPITKKSKIDHLKNSDSVSARRVKRQCTLSAS
mmetsp:Transcript_7809/g.11833  ORF Transcript_7809/g.11833 Transcript_7809/m.11833 type:complete len:277 (+) Transcript_7809:38-868(+)